VLYPIRPTFLTPIAPSGVIEKVLGALLFMYKPACQSSVSLLNSCNKLFGMQLHPFGNELPVPHDGNETESFENQTKETSKMFFNQREDHDKFPLIIFTKQVHLVRLALQVLLVVVPHSIIHSLDVTSSLFWLCATGLPNKLMWSE
jgi:hypothetical protein